jgi:hypothetical protein
MICPGLANIPYPKNPTHKLAYKGLMLNNEVEGDDDSSSSLSFIAANSRVVVFVSGEEANEERLWKEQDERTKGLVKIATSRW